jgi:hypothetical protein
MSLPVAALGYQGQQVSKILEMLNYKFNPAGKGFRAAMQLLLSGELGSFSVG